METNYSNIIHKNLSKRYEALPAQFEHDLDARREGDRFCFRAFGEDCCLGPEGITLSGNPVDDPKALLVSLYALHAHPEPVQIEPLKAFRELPNSMPYQGAFATNSEKVLIPYVSLIKEKRASIHKLFSGKKDSREHGGDFSLLLFPLPKIALCYIFYLPDEEFPASATCLFSANAVSFMPLDGLADVAEYTSRKMIEICKDADRASKETVA